MSSINIATLPKLTASSLSTLLLDPQAAPGVAVIDVRDSDHVGGHIRSSRHVPSSTLDYKLPELVRSLQDKDVVVFHCMLSQQRGPNAALQYARERVRLLGKDKGRCVLVGEEAGEGKAQKVMVLEKGFDGWQQQFGDDERLTEAFEKELWRGED